MSQERHAHVKAVFLAACEIPADRRAEFLEKQCGNDPELRAQVEQLLLRHADTRVDSVVHGQDAMEKAGHRVFPPGHLVANRYRIIDPLGQGGMGEVYRAEDIRVGYPVALKFLLPDFISNSLWRKKLCEEVRIARRVTHRNVCRIFDVTEATDALFISMEYVTGENLRSLLLRIGRVPQEKALDIAQQLCAGLAAAHAQGVLHRDLKPANVMLDDRGQIKIMDFGLAGIEGEIRRKEIRSGTPAYMAPEQWAGTEVTTRSDIYALGLVLHELFTGKSAVPVQTDQNAPPPSPVISETHLDPLVDRVIRQCLEPNPQNRPQSVLDLSAALPGGSHLTATLAAGLTPSPTMVATAHSPGGISLPRGFFAILSMAVMLVFVYLLSPLVHPILQTSSFKSPHVLIDKAREITRQMVPTLGPADEAYGLLDGFPIKPSASPAGIPGSLNKPSAKPNSLALWYRTGSKPLVPSDPWNVLFENGRVTPADPDPLQKDMVTLVVDGKGNLLSTRVLPELSIAATDNREPTVGTFPQITPDMRRQFLEILRRTLLWIGIVVSLPLAWINIRRGRSDLAGAFRLAAFVFCLRMAVWFLQTHYLTDFQSQLRQTGFGAIGALVVAGLAYLIYVALEPYIRRFWPHAIISWTRLLAGRGLDPLVGRDVLAGTVLGVFWAFIFRLDRWIALSLNLTVRDPIRPADFLTNLLGPGQGLASILKALGEAVTEAGIFLMLVTLLRVLLHRPRLALALAFVLIAPIYVPLGSHPAVSWVMLGIGGVGVGLWVLTRLGIMPLVTALLLVQILNRAPLTFNLKVWYADIAGLALLTTLGLALYGLIVSGRKTT